MRHYYHFKKDKYKEYDLSEIKEKMKTKKWNESISVWLAFTQLLLGAFLALQTHNETVVAMSWVVSSIGALQMFARLGVTQEIK